MKVLRILLIFSLISVIFVSGCVSQDKYSIDFNLSSLTPAEKLSTIKTYANTYVDYNLNDLEKLKKFDIVMIEPYNMPKEWVKQLKDSGVIVVAYISVGEADDERRYWKSWQPTERAYEIETIPRTTVDHSDDMFIGPDPGWPGSWFVDASNARWKNIILNEEIPYILELGGGNYDGIVMDLIDVVDEYDRLYEEGVIDENRKEEMKQGMIDLICSIKKRYSNLIVIPNRGFGILEEVGACIDGFKFEELTLKYNNIPGQISFEQYDTQLDETGKHDNQEHIDMASKFAKEWKKPVFVLDHVETEPLDIESAAFGYKEANRLSDLYNIRFIWYANSVDQDLPIWDFLDFQH